MSRVKRINSGINLQETNLSYLAEELLSFLSIAELDLKASAMLMPLSIDGLFTRLLSKLPTRLFWDKLKLKYVDLSLIIILET